MPLEERAEFRRRLLAVHPEWAGRIWFTKETVVVRHLGSVWPIVRLADFDSALDYLEDMVKEVQANAP